MKSSFKFDSLPETISFFKLENNIGKEFVIKMTDCYYKNGYLYYNKEIKGIFIGLSNPIIKILNNEGDVILYNLSRHFIFRNQKIIEIDEQ